MTELWSDGVLGLRDFECVRGRRCIGTWVERRVCFCRVV